MRNKNAKVSDPNTFYSCEGDQYHIEYSPKIMPDGTIQLIESGKTDIQEFINAQREGTDMAYILKQLAVGNTDVINVKQGQYGDFTEMPKTYAEALQLRIDAEKSFYELPVDIRNKFENDFNRYFATAGTEEWAEKLGLNKKLDEKGEPSPAQAEPETT